MVCLYSVTFPLCIHIVCIQHYVGPNSLLLPSHSSLTHAAQTEHYEVLQRQYWLYIIAEWRPLCGHTYKSMIDRFILYLSHTTPLI